MATRTASNAIYTAIAWSPFLLVGAAVLWVLAVGVLHLEILSFGTEWFVTNEETINRFQPLPSGGGDAAALQAALDSGDPAVMSAALDAAMAEPAAASAAVAPPAS